MLNKTLSCAVGTMDGLCVVGDNVGVPVVDCAADGTAEEKPAGDDEGARVSVKNSALDSVSLTSKNLQSPKYIESELLKALPVSAVTPLITNS